MTDGVALFRESSPVSSTSLPHALPIPLLSIEGSLQQRLNGFCTLRAAEWQLDQPSWSGRLRITAKGQVAYIKLEDRTTGKGQGSLCGAEVPCHSVKGEAAPLRGHGNLSWKLKTPVYL